jgi:hypothetical protein
MGELEIAHFSIELSKMSCAQRLEGSILRRVLNLRSRTTDPSKQTHAYINTKISLTYTLTRVVAGFERPACNSLLIEDTIDTKCYHELSIADLETPWKIMNL